MSKKVGILGGTFDPIHLGHISIAEKAVLNIGLSNVMLIPNGAPPHKNNNEITSSYHRFQMALLAAEGLSFLSVSDIETRTNEYCYTVDTIKKIKEEEPENEYFYIIGADNIDYMKQWKDARRLLNGLNIICFSREGYDMQKDGEALERDYGSKLYYMNMKTIPISSTDIRMKIKDKLDVAQYLNKAVYDYIIENGLYGV